MKQFLIENKKPALFFLKLTLSYILLSLIEDLLRSSSFGPSLESMSDLVSQNAASLFRILGYEAQSRVNATLYINNIRTVHVGYPCNGISIFIVFISFIIAVPGKIKDLSWFIPLGILSVHSINVLRVFCLAVIYLYDKSLVDFNHKYVFTAVVYTWVMLLFRYWIKRFSVLQKFKSNGSENS